MTVNKIQVEGAKAMSDMLKVNTSLKELNLECEKEKTMKLNKRIKNNREYDWSGRSKSIG